MHFSDQGPHHLADVVLRALSLNETKVADPALLTFFFDVLYEASFRSDLGHPLLGSVIWQDPVTLSSASLSPSEKQGWSYLSLTHPIPFNVNTVVSVMKGIDPRSTALAVYTANPRHPVIHGLMNYSAALADSWIAEDPSRSSPFFRATITGPSHLLVDVGLEHPVELIRNRLYTHAHDVLRRGPVRDRLSAKLADLLPTLKTQLPPNIVTSLFFEAGSLPLAGGSVLINEHDWSEILERLWTDALVQLLLHIFQSQQGGAVLVTPNRTGIVQGEPLLTFPYTSSYPQLRLVLERHILFAITQHVLSAKALSEWTRPLQEMAPDNQALHEPDLLAGPPGSDQAIRQAIAFIASLARFEGILLLSPQLDVNGFGGQPITEVAPEDVYLAGDERVNGFGGQPIIEAAPEDVYLAGDERATELELTAISYRSFGPRNQALIRHCYQDHEAIAFAFTQDGDLRAMMWLEGKVIVWNQVRLRRL